MAARAGKPVIDRRVALLRGINAGRAKRIAMADLRTLFEGLGYRDVRTLLNSGNVVFTVPPKGVRADAERIERAIAEELGVSTRVILLLGREVADAVRGNPLAPVARDPSRLLLMALRDAKAVTKMRRLLAEPWSPEVLAVGKRVAYLWCASGILDSRLWVAAARAVGDAGTARNVATMTKLLALLEDA
jgi:uncharacterized protein (DUF1697 family)